MGNRKVLTGPALPTIFRDTGRFSGFQWMATCPSCGKGTMIGQDHIGFRAKLVCSCSVKEDSMPRCANCGYTALDVRIHLDHDLCGFPDPPEPTRRQLMTLSAEERRPWLESGVERYLKALKEEESDANA